MTSKETILRNIAKNKSSKTVALPSVSHAHNDHWLGNLQEKYLEGIAGAGSKGYVLGGLADVPGLVAELYDGATNIVCTVDGVSIANGLDSTHFTEPHHLKDVDLAIVPGEFAVAENGAVWVTLPKAGHRALYYLPQHVLIVVGKDQVVATMHEAYQRLDFSGAGYGVFIAGPSKTADIEQSLVIGAHGPMSTYVALV